MKIVELKKSEVCLGFSVDELITLSNITNELCNGLDISDEEFETRVGVSHKTTLSLLGELLEVIDTLEAEDISDEKTKSELSSGLFLKSIINLILHNANERNHSQNYDMNNQLI